MTEHCPQTFDWFLVLDFEATCDDKVRLHPQEIIEFPVLKVNGKTYEVEDVFHHYVLPEVNPILTPFCTQLTSITQDQVDGKLLLKQILKLLDDWLIAHGLRHQGSRYAFVTCGDWDLKTMLPSQCQYLNIDIPEYFNRWINIKKVFEEVTGIKPRRQNDLLHMMEVLNLQHQGIYHSGIDDCHNILKVMKALAEKDHVYSITSRLPHSKH